MSAPYMPFYPADYLGDTRHLTTEQHGAYLLLLMTMWRSDGVLPKDDAKLARIVGLTVARWKRISDDVLAFFDDCEGGITQARLAAELAISDEKSEKRSQAGKLGGRAKALKDKKAAVANAMPMPCQPEPEPEVRVEANASTLSPAKPTTYPEPFEAAWKAYPHVKGRSSKPKALGFWRRLPPATREALPSAIARYARDGREPKADCGAPAMQRWLSEARFEDWLTPDTSAAPSAPASPELTAHRLQHFAKTGEWRSTWGPKPAANTNTPSHPPAHGEQAA